MGMAERSKDICKYNTMKHSLLADNLMDDLNDDKESCGTCLGDGCEECDFTGYAISPDLKIIEEFEKESASSDDAEESML